MVADMSHLDWGSVPVWVGTLVTSTSAAVAVVSYRRNLYDREREQASKVSCWAVVKTILRVQVSTKEHYSADIVIDAKAVNRSDASVYDLEVSPPPGSSGKTLRGIELPPGITATGEMQLRITATPKISSDEDQIDMNSLIDVRIPTEIQLPTLTFTDALGRRWRKRGSRVRRVRRRTRLRAEVMKAGPGAIPEDSPWKAPASQDG